VAGPPRVVLIHGAATTSRVWRYVVPQLDGFDVLCPDRPCSGDLATEVAALTADCRGAVVAGVSGGATLGLALAAAGVPMTAALLHEPAVGSLLPGLLAPYRDAYASGGTAAFAAALYGPAWTPAEAPADADAVVARELAMFAAFEPVAPDPAAGPVVVTVGECSPPVRHESVRRLAERFALPQWTIPGARHAAHLDHPEALAAAIRRLATSGPAGPAGRPAQQGPDHSG
jgi:pimeloyl-ACP methyl ester carboxylesterase